MGPDNKVHLKCAPIWEALVFQSAPFGLFEDVTHLDTPCFFLTGAQTGNFEGIHQAYKQLVDDSVNSGVDFCRAMANRFKNQQAFLLVPDTGHFLHNEKVVEVGRLIYALSVQKVDL